MHLLPSCLSTTASASEASWRRWRAFGSVSRCERSRSTRDDPLITLCKFVRPWMEQHCGSPVMDGVCWEAGVIVMDDRLLILLREALLNTFLSLFLSRYSLFSSYSASNCFCVYPDTFYYPLFPPIVVPAAWMLSSFLFSPCSCHLYCPLHSF